MQILLARLLYLPLVLSHDLRGLLDGLIYLEK